MAKLKLPAPPKSLNPAPKRPGEGNGTVTPTDAAKEAGRHASSTGSTSARRCRGAARWLMFRKVPKGTNWFYTLGSATMFAFLNQAVTGVFLAMYYDPSPTRAYESIRYITNDVFLGEFVRGMHKWGSTVMVILIFLHMARTFFFGAYKYPRELNWVIGVVLLILTFVDVVHRLPAAVRPALLLGDDRRRATSRQRPARRPVPRGLPARRPRVRRDDAVALLRDPHAARAGPHRRADRRPPVPRRQARHDGAAVA